MSKNFFRLWLTVAAVLLAGSLTACGWKGTPPQPDSSPATENPKPLVISPAEYSELMNGKTLAMVAMKNSAEYNRKVIESYFQNTLKLDLKYDSFVYVDSLTDGLLMLRSHRVDFLHVMRFTGDYLQQRSADLRQYWPQEGVFTTQMIFSPRQYARYQQIDAIIKAMREDGTLDKMIDRWITSLPVGEEPSGGEIEVIEGAETLKIGVSDDEPPLDYIAANGLPGGFNMAVLSEISRRANLNIQPVTVVSGARFAALQSGKIDGFLWHNALQGSETLPEDVISPEKETDPDYLYKTISYLDDKESILALKN